MPSESDNDELRDADLLIQEAMGRPMGAYALFLTNDQEVVKALILEGVAIGQHFAENDCSKNKTNTENNFEK